MTPRTLFIIILRVLGILSLKELFIAIPQLISAIVMFFQGYSISGGLFMIVISLLTVALVLWISYALIFKADFLVARLGLDQNFTESILPDWSPAVFSGVKIVLALLIIGERNRILQFLEKSPNAEGNEK